MRGAVTRVLALLTALAVAAGCGSAADPDSIVAVAEDTGTVTIGIRHSQPGLSERTLDGRYVGFDVDVARFVAAELGVAPEDISWRDVVAADREAAITSGAVDLIVGSYSITEERKEKVAFAGPYFETGQSLLVRVTTDDITGPGSLNGKKLCSVSGSTSARHVKESHARGVELVEYPRYRECVTALLAGQVDAVTTDEAILAGHVAHNPELLKIVGEHFSEERYGIGLRKGDDRGRQALNDAIQKMVDEGEWQASLRRNLGPSGIGVPPPPEITER
jgi:glutamate transport system substrate-binding protein